MVSSPASLEDLTRALGANAVRPSTGDEFSVHGLAPQAVVTPADAEQVAACLRYASEVGIAVIPWSGGTLMSIGNVPTRYDIALDLRKLDGVLEHQPADLTVSVQAGITIAALQERLASSGQFLPLDVPHPENATIGGVLAADARGAWEGAYGSSRDWVIGLRVVTADGRLTKAGGKVVKNVAGYDLCKLYVGSLGTLGVIVEATFKVSPLPRQRAQLALTAADPASACRLARELQRRGLAIESAELQLLPAVAPRLLLGLAGTPAGVERSLAEAHTVAAEAGCQEIATFEAPVPTGEFICRLTCPPTRLPEVIAGLQALSPAPALLARPLSGTIITAWPQADATRLLSELRSLEVNVVAEVCPPGTGASLDVFGQPGPDFALMRRLKQQFDPAGVLNPGRFLGRL